MRLNHVIILLTSLLLKPSISWPSLSKDSLVSIHFPQNGSSSNLSRSTDEPALDAFETLAARGHSQALRTDPSARLKGVIADFNSQSQSQTSENSARLVAICLWYQVGQVAKLNEVRLLVSDPEWKYQVDPWPPAGFDSWLPFSFRILDLLPLQMAYQLLLNYAQRQQEHIRWNSCRVEHLPVHLDPEYLCLGMQQSRAVYCRVNLRTHDSQCSTATLPSDQNPTTVVDSDFNVTLYEQKFTK